MEENSLTQRLRGRAAYLRDNGEVKSPDLMEDAADEIERLQRIIDSRPAINAGLPETYIQWSQGMTPPAFENGKCPSKIEPKENNGN